MQIRIPVLRSEQVVDYIELEQLTLGIVANELDRDTPFDVKLCRAILIRTFIVKAAMTGWRHKAAGAVLCDKEHCLPYKELSLAKLQPFRRAVTEQNVSGLVVAKEVINELAEPSFEFDVNEAVNLNNELGLDWLDLATYYCGGSGEVVTWSSIWPGDRDIFSGA